MSIDLDELETIVSRHGRVARVVIASTSGSVPREAGAAMLVWPDGQSGTIGGGALEFDAAAAARETIVAAGNVTQTVRQPLGPGLGQCCGGSVVIVTELFDESRVNAVAAQARKSGVYLRPASANAGEIPDGIRRAVRRAPSGTHLANGWISEPVARLRRPLWLFGAGHVGRAVVSVLEPMDAFGIVWVDMSEDRFPPKIPGRVKKLVAANPADAVGFAPEDAEFLVMTHSHSLDLDICNRILGVPFRYAGLIGSGSKWARFRKRLAEAGRERQAIERINCPIGIPGLGKHPQAIAIGVACRLLGEPWPETEPTGNRT